MIHPISRHSFIIHSDTQSPYLITTDSEQQGVVPLDIEGIGASSREHCIVLKTRGTQSLISIRIPRQDDDEYIRYLDDNFYSFFEEKKIFGVQL